MNSVKTATHFLKEKLTALCGQGFHNKGFITTSDSPSCWACWAAWENIPYEERKNWHLVKMNGKFYPFNCFSEAIFFTIYWNGELMTPITNP